MNPVYLRLTHKKQETGLIKYLVYNATYEMTKGENYHITNSIAFYRKPYSDRIIDDDTEYEIITEEEFKLEAL